DAKALLGTRRRHPDVGEHDIGRVVLDRRQQLVSVRADRDEIYLWSRAQGRAEKLPNHVGVLGHGDPDGCLVRCPASRATHLEPAGTRGEAISDVRVTAHLTPPTSGPVNGIHSGRAGARLPAVARAIPG